MRGPTKVLSGVNGSVAGGQRWIVTSGKLYVERELLGVGMRRYVAGFEGYAGDPPPPAEPECIERATVQELVAALVARAKERKEPCRAQQ